MEENVAKALLIAAGMMITVMILSLLVLGYNEISEYYNLQSEKTTEEQLAEFNKEFQNYERKKIRGTELISLINKVIDYNERQAYADGLGYERIEMSVNMKNGNLINKFKYDEDDESIFGSSIQIDNITTGATNKDKDNSLLAFTYVETNLIQDAKANGINNLTTAKLQKLSSNIENIVIDEEHSSGADKKKRKELIENIIGKEFEESQLEKVKEITCKYYQYTQFKRSYFSCDEMLFDSNTGRVCGIKIALMTKINNAGEEVIVQN